MTALSVVGIALGLGGGVVLGRVVRGLLFGTGGTDATGYVAGVLFIALAVLVASYVPARRASTIDPMRALRYE